MYSLISIQEQQFKTRIYSRQPAVLAEDASGYFGYFSLVHPCSFLSPSLQHTHGQTKNEIQRVVKPKRNKAPLPVSASRLVLFEGSLPYYNAYKQAARSSARTYTQYHRPTRPPKLTSVYYLERQTAEQSHKTHNEWENAFMTC